MILTEKSTFFRQINVTKEVTIELILRNFFSVIIFSTTFLHRRCDLKRLCSWKIS